MITQVRPKQAKEKMENKEAIMIDVRRSDERAESYIPGTIWLTLGELSEESLLEKGIKKDQELILQCRSGGRSQKAAEAMEKWGYSNLSNLEGGILEWIDLAYKVD